MVRVIERCFQENLEGGPWLAKLKEMIPSYGRSLAENAALCQQVRAETATVLRINNIDESRIHQFEAKTGVDKLAA